jgi:hypothetical protein
LSVRILCLPNAYNLTIPTKYTWLLNFSIIYKISYRPRLNVPLVCIIVFELYFRSVCHWW